MSHPESERFVPARRPSAFPTWTTGSAGPVRRSRSPCVGPTSEPAVDGVSRPLPTPYVQDRLLVRTSDDLGGSRVDRLAEAAKALDWVLDRTD